MGKAVEVKIFISTAQPGEKMKYAILIAGLYELTVGLSEVLWVSTGSTSLASLAALPSAATLADSAVGSSSNANSIEGGIDVAIGAGLLYWFFRV
jgi:hypothetical protein